MGSGFVIIVSGLPRAGTSMMMQALEAGGITPLTDNIRKRDIDNPKGYYEYEPVKRTKTDSSWLQKAEGKAVKMVFSLLHDLPDDYEYRVVFMQRDMNEVLSSQQKMLDRLGRKGADIGKDMLAKHFQTQLSKTEHWINTKDNFSILYVNHREMINFPKIQCELVDTFLGGVLNSDAAAAVVDTSLFRNRS